MTVTDKAACISPVGLLLNQWLVAILNITIISWMDKPIEKSSNVMHMCLGVPGKEECSAFSNQNIILCGCNDYYTSRIMVLLPSGVDLVMFEEVLFLLLFSQSL